MPTLKRGVLPVIFLVVIIVWALFAVTMLTGTLLSTQEIENRVGIINTALPGIKQNTESIKLAADTAKISAAIDRAVKPIGPQFTQIVEAGGGIVASAQSIADRAGEINASVRTINAAVGTIGASVVPIGDNLAAVNGNVAEINSSAHGIGDSFAGILATTRTIKVGVAGINSRADAVIGVAGGIKDDLDRVNTELVPDIIRNSAAIRDSPVINVDVVKTLNQLMAQLHLPPALSALQAVVPGPLLAAVPAGPALAVADPAPAEPAEGATPGIPLLGGLLGR